MFRVLLTFLALSFAVNLFGQNFVTRWDTNQPGSPNSQVTIPTNPGFSYNYTVNWGDGNTDTNVNGNITHTYAASGIYTIEISGDFPAIYFNDTGDRRKIIEILEWGTIQWQTMEDAFHGCENLNFDAIDAPDLSQVTSLKNMFRSCTSFNGIVNNWNVGTIEDISGLFASCSTFNRPLDLWNTIAVTNMEETFISAGSFNEPLDNWNTASVTTMRFMFSGASSFNQNINNWDVSQVTDMSGMFSYTGSFNQPLNSWNVSNVTDMSQMFQGSGFNFPIGNWNVDGVINMSGMFREAQFNHPIESWNVSSVTDFSEMFMRHRTFNHPLNNWDVSNATDMSSMFDGWIWGCIFNQPLNNWNVSNVTNMSYMFRDNSDFNQDISGWDVSSVTNMQGMFEQTDVFNQDISAWNVSNVDNMISMFQQAEVFDQPLNTWNVSNVTSISAMFFRATAFNQPLDSWDMTGKSNLQNMFHLATSFNQDLSSWNTSEVTIMSGMFVSASSFDQNLASWNISAVTNMANMLSDSGLSQENYDNTLIGWASQTVIDDVDLGAASLTYCDGLSAREDLVNNHNWNITGDSVNCSFVLCTEITMPAAGDTQVPANSDIRWAPAPNATGYQVTVTRDEGSGPVVVYDQTLPATSVGVDFTNEFSPGDEVSVLVVPFNDEGPATGCSPINFTVVESWVNSPDAFKLTYDTTIQYLTFTTPINQLLIETAPGQTYDFSIDWGDGQYNNNITSDIVHTYLVPGAYTVSIIGTFPAPRHEEFNSDAQKLLSIDQWGTQVWQSMQGAFAGCENMEYNASDVPNLSQVTDMSRMFIVCRNFNGDINNWDVSNVTNMYGMFGVADIFNQPLDNWDVGNVTTMGFMFAGTKDFDQPLNSWNVANVTDFSRMFRQAESFNQPLNNWNTGSAQDMSQMFERTAVFNQPLNNWNTSNVEDMEEMFSYAEAFNQNIDSWNVSSVIGMGSMFNEAQVFNQPLNSWDVSSVDEMRSMFRAAEVFNQPLNNWDVSSVVSMSNMFSSASDFNQNINSWNVTNVTDMSGMFSFAVSFDQPLNNWDVNSVVNMSNMFRGAEVFNQPLSNWNVSAVANMTSMFQAAVVFNQPIEAWDVSSVTLMESMFENAEAFDQELDPWDVSVVTNFNSMFKNAFIFNRPLNSWNTGEALNMAEMFSGAAVFNQNLDNWNVSFVTTMQEMFRDAADFNQSLNSWNVASVTTMQGMFQNATSFNGIINNWNVRAVTSMRDMFNGATNFNQSINDWRINGVTTMEGMFRNATSFNQSFELWTPGTVSMRSMFSGATSFDQYLGYWNIENVADMQNMLDNTVLPRENYDNTLIDWSEQTLNAGITLGALGLPYCDALQERQSIIDTYGWNIIGDVLDCPVPECTQLVSPLNGASDVPVNTNLTWEHALYAENYDLTITILPSNTVINETVTETNYQFANGVLSLGDSVSVLIVPVNGEGSAVGCTTESFTIASTPPTVPDCTSLSLPLDDAVDVPIDTALEWNPIANADGYRITAGTSSGGNDVLNDENVGNVTTFDLPTDLPEDTEIFVTITPYNEVGDALGCFEESFTTELIPVPPACTTLTSPVNGTVDVPIDTDISWNAVDGATGYLVIVGTSQGGNDVAPSIDVDTGTTYDFPTDLQENRTYYVTIIPYNDVGDALGCVEESFRTGESTLNDPPACTTLASPLNGDTDVAIDLAEISWNATANADGYRVTIDGSISDVNDVNDLVVTTNSHSFANDFENGETVTVTIVPFNVNGDASGCTSENFSIVDVAPMPPDCTTLLDPLNGAVDVPVGTAISWNPVIGATGYTISLSTTSGPANIFIGDVGNVTTYQPANDFPNSTLIYVVVTPYNADGNAIGCAEETFTTQGLGPVPSCTSLTSPLNDAIDVPIDTNLEWTPVPNATGYRVRLSTVSGVVTIIDADAGNTTTFDPPNDLPQNTVIYATVIPYNDAGDAINCTEESFTTIRTVPECATLTSPLNGATDVPFDLPNITWTDVVGATGYRLTLTGTQSDVNDIVDVIVFDNAYSFSGDFIIGEMVSLTLIPFNDNGDATPCFSESFMIGDSMAVLPECTNLSSPMNFEVDVPIDTTISWDTAQGAEGYRLTIGTSPGLGDILNQDVGNVTSFDLPNNLPENTEIFVFVQPYNSDGNAEFCEEESFITAITPPDLPLCTTLSVPEDGSTDVAVNTNISWRAVGDISGYLLNIGTSEGSSDILSEDVGLTTSHTLAQDLPFGEEIFVTIIPYNESVQAQGCESQSFTTVEEIEEVESLFGFSPDGDGNNDFWTINGIEEYPNNTVMIFNRWGDMVFKIEGYDNGSNVFQGEANLLTGMGAGQLPEGTYFFQINIPSEHNLKTTQGYLVLKR